MEALTNGMDHEDVSKLQREHSCNTVDHGGHIQKRG